MAPPAFLIVDDDALLRLLLRRLIADHYPYAPVYSVGSVADAQEKLWTAAPTIVLTDYYLLDGTGLDVLRAARMYMSSIPVVVHSGDVTLAQRVRAAGAGAFLSKPYDSTELGAILARLCAEQRQAA